MENRPVFAGGAAGNMPPHGSGGAGASLPGSPDVPAASGGSVSGGSPGFPEVPGMLPFQPGSSTGGTSGSGTGGTPDPGIPPVAGRKLRDTVPGDAVVFDPDEVYADGYVSDVDGYVGPLGIAPLADTRDTVIALPLFNEAQIRRTDGHLLYSFNAPDANGEGFTTPLYEFRRDEADLEHLTKGEAVLAEVTAGCASVPSKTTGLATGAGNYAAAFDGPLYYSCYVHETAESNEASWYSASGSPQPRAPGAVVSIGAEGRALAWSEDGSYTVFDFVTGATFQSHSTRELLGDDPSSTYALATRAHASGFWLAGGPPGDEPSAEVRWVSLDAAGAIVATGLYPPLPAGITLQSNNWGRASPVLDGKGAFYQYAFDGTDGVIVRRPMVGESTVAYRSSSYDPSNAHQVAPQALVTGR
jgi:hypothetical protein